MQWLTERTDAIWQEATASLASTEFYVQIGIVAGALILAWALSALLISRVRIFREEPKPGALFDLRLSCTARMNCCCRSLPPSCSESRHRSAPT